MAYYSVLCYVTFYAIPVVLFIFFYGSVIITLRKRMKSSDLGTSRTIDKANDQLTKTVIVVTFFFLITIGYELTYYMLGYTKTLPYEKNTPVQKAGVFAAVMNSCANPFIYAIFMPVYRQSVIKTILCQSERDGKEETSRTHSTNVSTASTQSISKIA